MKKVLGSFVVMFFLSGCTAGKVDYIKPSSQTLSNTKIIQHSKDAVWDASVPELSKRFFVINNLDKSSGLINVSYTGDPEQYVDCGQISSYVKNVAGERTYKFPASKAQQQYETLDGINLFSIKRKMNLDGRLNVIFEDNGQNQTKVTVNTKYIVTKQLSVTHAGDGAHQDFSDTISFNTGSRASFPTQANGNATECVSTGQLEQDILSAIK